MLLDKSYGLLNLLEFKFGHFSSPFQAEPQFQNSNVGAGNSLNSFLNPKSEENSTLVKHLYHVYFNQLNESFLFGFHVILMHCDI